MKTQDQLYQEFLATTAPQRAEFEAKVKAASEQFEAFRKPHDELFDAETADIKSALIPEVEAIDKDHRYACHKAVLKSGIHKKLDKLEKYRLKKMKPLQAKWDALTADHQAKLREVVNPKAEEYNTLIERLNNEFNELNKPAHDAYMAEAQALERELLNTPVDENKGAVANIPASALGADEATLQGAIDASPNV
ncbi:MAG: hypothetical protein ACJ8R9_10875 [Steroidobacteraceae bacterium]